MMTTKFTKYIMTTFVFLFASCVFFQNQACGSNEVSLDGADWQCQKVADAALNDGPPPPESAWAATTVPGYLYGWKYERAWFKKTFTVGQKAPVMKLRFNGVKYNSRIYINDHFVGGNLGGYEPFEVDVSGYIDEGVNTLYVGVYDWTGTFTGPAFTKNYVDLSATSNLSAQANKGTFNVVISAIGNFYYYYGIWDSVSLLLSPEVYIDDVSIKTSVRSGRIDLGIAVKNNNPGIQNVTVKNSILDKDNVVVKTLPSASLDIEGGSSMIVNVGDGWVGPALWSPANPYLYKLKTEIMDSGNLAIDEKITRFGFREFWRDGIYFYLNGIKIKLLGTSTHPPTKYMDEAKIRTVLKNVKDGNNVVFRLHAQPWPKLWYEVADDMGLLIIEESAYFGNSWQNNKYSDPVFWDNYKAHLERVIKRDRNHPSVIMWSLENELQHIGNDHESITDELAQLVSYVKGIDDTRLVYFEGDLDPENQADVIGLHYPHEYPENYAYPNTAEWDAVNRPGMYIDGFQWDKTSSDAKPLYVGEFGWIYTWLSDAFSIKYGDKAYNDPTYYRGNTFIWGYYRNKARADIWGEQIQAYREKEVSGISPWTIFDDASIETRDELDLNIGKNMLYEAQKRAFEPVRFFVKNADRNFFSNSAVERDIVIHNDKPEAADLRLEWDTGYETGSESYLLGPAELEKLTITFTTPKVAAKTALTLNLKLYKDDTLVFEENKQYAVYPRANLTIGSGRIGLYDAGNTTKSILDANGISYAAVTDISDIPQGLDLLIIGAGALSGAEDLGVLDSMVERGMNTLILEQDCYPASLNITLVDAPATWVFKRASASILFDGIGDEDLMYWREDNYILRKNIVNPSSGNYRVLADSGNFNTSIYSPVGLNYSPIVEILKSRGKYVLSQVLIGEKYGEEPIANMLLNNLIRYALVKKAPYSATAVFGDNAAMTQYLQAKGFNYSSIATLDNLGNYRLLIISGSADAAWDQVSANSEKINQFVNNGGRLLLHGLNKVNYDKLNKTEAGIFNIPYEMKDAVLYPILKNNADEFTSGLSDYDLNWLSNYQLKQNIADSHLVKRYDLPGDPAPAELNAINFSDKTVKTGKPDPADPSKWFLFASGYIEHIVDFGANLQNTLSITAAGTPAGGIYPIMAVKIDGIEAYRFSVNDASYRDYTFSGIPPGSHAVRIEFVNFAYIAPDYRRLKIDKIRYGASASLDNYGVVELTRPAALMRINKEGGQIVIDNIKWESETNDPKRALRYASNILTNLGSRFGAPFADFSAPSAGGIAPITIGFTDESAGMPVSWLWGFGDGATSAEKDPVHTYNSAGNYEVSLTVTNSAGSDTEIKNGYITVTAVNRPPVLNPIGNRSVNKGDTLTITLTSSDPDGDTVTYSKNAGSVGTLNGNIFTYTPGRDKSGKKTVTFTATDGEFSDSETIKITVDSRRWHENP
jgi:PKD repeat protein